MLEHKLEKQKSGSKSTNKNNISNVDNNMVEPDNVELEAKLDKVTNPHPTNYNQPKVNNQTHSNIVTYDIHHQN